MTARRPWRAVEHGVALDVRVTPKGGRDAIGGIETLADGQAVLKLRVRAAPTDGQANEAVIALVAKSLQLPKSKVALVRGEGSRVKTLRIAGDPKAILSSLAALTEPSREPS